MKKVMVLFVAVLWATIGFSDEALKGLYKFDDGSGVVAVDSSGNGNDATLVNDPLWVSDGELNALEFDKTLQTYLTCGNGTSLSGAGDFTLSGWVKSTNGSKMTIFFQRATSSEDFDGLTGSYTLNIDGKGKIAFIPHTGNKSISINSTVKLNDDQWHNFAIVRENGTVKVYVDGVLDVEKDGVDLSFNGEIATIIGAQITESTQRYFFDGLLDDLSIRSRALSLDEIEFYANIRGIDFSNDEDGDGLTNGQEFLADTNIYDADEDGDGLSDKIELAYGTNSSVHNGNVKEGFELRAIGSVDDYTVSYDEAADSHIFNVRSGDIWGTSDNFVFVAKPLTNNSRLTVKLHGYTNGSSWSKAGVMVRDSYEADSRYGFTLFSGGSGSGIQSREETAGSCVKEMGYGNKPMWLTIVCHNGRVTSYVSDDFSNGTFHWIKVGSQDVTFNANTKVGLAVCSNNHNKAVQVKLSNLEVAVSDDLDGDSITDWEEQNVEKTNELFEDTEDDSINDDVEIVSGTHPNFPETLIDDKTFHKRGLISKYFNGIYSDLPKFNELPLYSVGTVDELYFPAVKTNIVGSSLSKGGATFSGKLYIDVEGEFKFYTKSNDGSELYINDKLIVANGGLHGVQERNGTVSLPKGFHDIEINFFNATGDGTLKMFWEGPNFVKQVIPASVLMHAQEDYDTAFDKIDQDGDGLTDKLEDEYGSDKTKIDSNGDGLTDFEKYSLGLDPMAADTDGDGVSDYDEVKNYQSDAKSIDFDGTETVVATVNGSECVTVKGEWEKSGSTVFSVGGNGSVEYSVNIPEEGMFVLRLFGRQHNSLSEFTSFTVDLYTDSLYTDRQVLNTMVGGSADYVLPYLNAGIHKIKLDWINVLTRHSLEISSLQLVKVNGADSNGNGKLDWQKFRLDNSSAFKDELPVESVTSPFCAEGITLFDGTVALTGSYDPQDGNYELTADGKVVVPVSNGIETYVHKNWYANAPLNPNGATTLTADFQNSAKTASHNVTWTATNIFEKEEITIRQGDSLLLTAIPENELEGDTVITVEGVTNPVTYGQKIQYCFENSGTVSVTATFTNAVGTTFDGTLTVNVVAANFENEPILLLDFKRTWENLNVPFDLSLEYSYGLEVNEYPFSPKGTRLDMTSRDAKPKKIVARLYENGPIVAAQTIKTLKYYISVKTEPHQIIEEFADGSLLIESELVLLDIPEDLEITLHIFVGGITFEDGSITKTFTAADFDEYGRLAYRMIRSAEAKSGNCHKFIFSQDDVVIYSFR